MDAGQLSINDASKLLQISFDSSKEALNEKVGHVLDVAWLTNEDEKDEVMSPDADDALLSALREAKESVLSAN